jgi:hypothetical protein
MAGVGSCSSIEVSRSSGGVEVAARGVGVGGIGMPDFVCEQPAARMITGKKRKKAILDRIIWNGWLRIRIVELYIMK